mgnify:FL=1|tara:strand:+ start:556 stop:771 length:216 start_codon:yes stop_codon:yes gene_type:complete
MTAEAYEKTNQANILSMAEAMRIERDERRLLEVKVEGLNNSLAMIQQDLIKTQQLASLAMARTHGSSTSGG